MQWGQRWGLTVRRAGTASAISGCDRSSPRMASARQSRSGRRRAALPPAPASTWSGSPMSACISQGLTGAPASGGSPRSRTPLPRRTSTPTRACSSRSSRCAASWGQADREELDDRGCCNAAISAAGSAASEVRDGRCSTPIHAQLPQIALPSIRRTRAGQVNALVLNRSLHRTDADAAS